MVERGIMKCVLMKLHRNMYNVIDIDVKFRKTNTTDNGILSLIDLSNEEVQNKKNSNKNWLLIQHNVIIWLVECK